MNLLGDRECAGVVCCCLLVLSDAVLDFRAQHAVEELLQRDVGVLQKPKSRKPFVISRHLCVVLLIRVPFWVPNIVLHPYNKDPKRDPDLDSYPYIIGLEALL